MTETSNRVDAIVKPDMLIWARESGGFSKEEVAHKLRIKLQKLEDWEKDVSNPTVKQLRRLGEIYKRPLAVFYLPEKPVDFQPLRDFRRIEVGIEFTQPIRLNLQVRLASYRRQVAMDLLEDLYGEIQKFDYRTSLTEDPEKIGVKIREILRVNYREQIKWNDNYEALDRWRLAIENTNVLVFQSSGISPSEMRGFSIGEFPLPVIGLNIKDSPKGRIFTLLHEFTHIMLKQSGICDVDEGYNRLPEEQKVEIFCNHVAGASLIPKDDLLNEDLVIRNKGKDMWTDSDLSFLSERFKASKEVVLRRLLIFGRTTTSFYKSKREEFLKEYERLRRLRRGGPVPLQRKVISSAGLTFVHLVLNSYYQEKITSSDLSDYLEVRLKHLPKIENEAMSKSVKLGALI